MLVYQLLVVQLSVPAREFNRPFLLRLPASPGGALNPLDRPVGATFLLPVRAPDIAKVELRRPNFGGKFQNLPG
jgi:hypothetical protein